MFGRNVTEQRERREQRERDKAANLGVLATTRLRSHNSGAAVLTAAPKPHTPRNATLLEMAHNRPCLLRVPGVCTNDTATTVACHENQGKGMGLKQSDARHCWGCAACHRWYDTGPAPREAKRTRFLLAHMDQVLAWRAIAADPSEPERFRKAARWALDQLNAESA